MKTAINFFLFVCAFSSCFAADGDAFQFTYNPGSTTVSVQGYQVTVTAEQRHSDKMVQVIAIPQEQGITFSIQGVDCTVRPMSDNPGGPVANVHGFFTFPSSDLSLSRMHRTVPVQIAPVLEFSTSSDEARVHGNPCVEVQAP